MFFFKYIIRQIIRKLIRYLKWHNTHIQDDLRSLQTRRWALALIYYYRSILCYCWVRFVGSLTPTLENFWERPLNVWKGHQQKTIPALRSEEQVPALGVPPGALKCRQHTPSPTLFIIDRYLSSNFNGARRLTGKAEGIVFTPSRFDQVRQRISPLKGASREWGGSGRFSARVC